MRGGRGILFLWSLLFDCCPTMRTISAQCHFFILLFFLRVFCTLSFLLFFWCATKTIKIWSTASGLGNSWIQQCEHPPAYIKMLSGLVWLTHVVAVCNSSVVVWEGTEVFRFDLNHWRPWKRHIVLHQRLRHGLLYQQVHIWHLQETHTETQHEHNISIYQQGQQNTTRDVFTHPCSLLCQMQLRREVHVQCGECDTFKHTLLHLGNHEPYQHAERWTTHVQAWSVWEILLQVMKCT